MTIRITTLGNGFRVATDPMTEVGTAAISLAFRAGARSEREDEHGLAHLLEHMAFKGTARRSARDIADEIEAVGGDLNAATGTEITTYEARVLAADVPLALDLLADIVTSPAFDPEELKREKGVILQEIGAVEDTPDDLVNDLLQEMAFAGQPLGRPILGTPKTVKALDRDALTGFLGRHYRGDAAVLAAAGAVDHDAVVEAAGRLLGGVAQPASTEPAPARWTGGTRRLVRRLEQAHVMIGWQGRPLGADDVLALQVFAAIAGGGMSSRLFQEVREKRGLAYAINAFHWGFADTGLLGVYAGTAGDDVAELVPVVLDELVGVAAAVEPHEVARAKAQMKMSLELAREQAGARADRLAQQLFIFGRPLPAEEILARLDAVTADDVRRAGTAALATAPAVAGIGPVAALWDGERVAARLGAAAAA
ncbi:MAG TPA: pitrilysin family protein [Hyphomicrobiales bacterium]|nr:pitrilysin family protein [Hyphomicrobiales bacterium]